MQPYFFRQCPANHLVHTIQPGETLYHIAQYYHVPLASIYQSNPGIDAYYLSVGQQICIPSMSPSGGTDFMGTFQAMQNDINALKAESTVQQSAEKNYGTSNQTTRVLKVTNQEIQFEAAPVTFQGNYSGHYTMGNSYPYYSDASMGGKRSITVKDNFGIWHMFAFQDPSASFRQQK
ncbi:LysM peptidoglycan-binding domain-containing protein [Paenibacillus cremeus]|uniref:LysM peptidoglycan-binding domain-containing protein n=1 Tax=Paenibacillus cremeus TaxID=2163881 RepID=A0A559K0G7_9BACL|nr:LysM domain-containing protein [Paenibacillus cremeus]TVY05586.1 LysM peptidoglycan-binding domain-containing protein [Paenibacillus cremeus]